jgi:hypothetical protein
MSLEASCDDDVVKGECKNKSNGENTAFLSKERSRVYSIDGYGDEIENRESI